MPIGRPSSLPMKWSCRLARIISKLSQVRFGTDEAGDVVDHEGIVTPGQAVAEGLGRGHVDAVVLAVGELASLAGLEIHELLGHVLAAGPCAAIVR